MREISTHPCRNFLVRKQNARPYMAHDKSVFSPRYEGNNGTRVGTRARPFRAVRFVPFRRAVKAKASTPSVPAAAAAAAVMANRVQMLCVSAPSFASSLAAFLFSLMQRFRAAVPRCARASMGLSHCSTAVGARRTCPVMEKDDALPATALLMPWLHAV